MIFWKKKANLRKKVIETSKSFLKYHTNEYDAIKGERIVVEAQRFSKVIVFSDRTSKHRGQRIKADNAEAWIEKAYVAAKK